MKLHTDKCKSMLMWKNAKIVPIVNTAVKEYINKDNLEMVDTYKYLGR